MGILASIRRSSLDLGCPRRLDVSLHFIETGNQSRRELRAIFRIKHQCLLEQLLRGRCHTFILGCGDASFNQSQETGPYVRSVEEKLARVGRLLLVTVPRGDAYRLNYT
jgi:hypothetical protein